MNNVIYDYQIFLQQEYGGISRYFYEVAYRIGGMSGFSANVFAPFYANSYLAMGRVNKFGFRVKKIRKLWRAYEALDMALSIGHFALKKPALVHETYYMDRRLAPKSCPVVVTVHDMIHEKFSEAFGSRDPTSAFKRSAVARADKIICVSEHTRRDLIEMLNVPEQKAVVVPLGFGLDVSADDIRPSLEIIDSPYLLFVGNREFHKNFTGLLHAYASSRSLQDEFSVVAFGGPPLTASEFQLIDRIGISRQKIRWLSGSDAFLAEVYKGATAFIYPSLYEGFGIPPLEAMASNCPVICSNASSIPEVVGDAAVFFDPAEPENIRSAIESVVNDDALKQSLVARGHARLTRFSWNRCAAATAAVYAELLN
jgi:glycosyltransferase involved in cell wall biosynthesis